MYNHYFQESCLPHECVHEDVPPVLRGSWSGASWRAQRCQRWRMSDKTTDSETLNAFAMIETHSAIHGFRYGDFFFPSMYYARGNGGSIKVELPSVSFQSK